MSFFKKLFFPTLFLFVFLLVPKPVMADDQFITIVNPVRISSYTKNPPASVFSEYSQVRRFDLPATWLLTFDALDNGGIISVVKNMDKKQEVGIFLEITPKFAQAAAIKYHGSGFWHFANSVFLSGYTQEERIKLIDAVFTKFKDIFGDYPTSVGSWWTDSYSLNYMKNKYGITANLGVSDQFSTDGYQVWGTYWSTPYIPSKYHTGVPAQSSDNKLDLVIFQWAPRDPLNGYESSLFSTQDYMRSEVGQNIDYFGKLIRLYAKKNSNQFGQVTVGLEGDFTEEAYKGGYGEWLEAVSRMAKSGEFDITNMHTFSDWYLRTFPDVSPPQKIESEGAVWYQSPHYRLGYVVDKNTGVTEIIDLRSYFLDLVEPYYASPNRDINLSINTPAIFDKMNYKKDIWTLPQGSNIVFSPDKVVIKSKKIDIPEVLENYPGVNVKKVAGGVEISFSDRWGIAPEGKIIKDFSAEAIHFFKQKKAILLLLLGKGWNYFKKVSYSIPQGEMFALAKLSQLPSGKVLVYNKECLQCSYHTEFKHPAFDNRRGYVEKFGKHQIVYDSGVLESKDRIAAKKLFDKLNVKYIYVVKFEDYLEKVPFSPGDLGIEKIFENANAQIWKVK